MSLSQYNEKRNFSETPEPKGKGKPSKNALRFVVQKHDATQVHYDFRLEMEGVLKSWAVPKGPSLNPADKRLAMAVEDHPYDYRTFEGVIPEGNYGAGTVMVWDEGTYEPATGAHHSKKEQEALLLKQLAAGRLKFYLHGKKLKGLFTLFRLKKGEANAWLLVKGKDEYAGTDDVTQQNRSVRSGKTLAEIAAEGGAVLHHPEEQPTTSVPTKKAGAAPPAKQTKTQKKSQPQIDALLRSQSAKIKKTPMPQAVQPMLASLVDAPFSGADWLFEIKWDGYRALAYKKGHDVALLSRNNKSFAQKYAPVTEALKALPFDAVLDGEIVAVNKNGLADFQLLQNWQRTKEGLLRYYIFDVLWLNGYDLTALPLIDRKALLQQLLPAGDAVLFYSDHVLENGAEFYQAAQNNGLEGIMAKRCSSTYQMGHRTDNWLKIKIAKRQEAIITGFTQPRNSRKFFGALLLGIYKGKELVYVGHTGSGFTRSSLEAVWKKLQPLVTDKSPFSVPPKTNMPATWVQPKLVCEIRFTEWTKDGQARHPIFMGLREDKKPKEVTLEKSIVLPDAASEKKVNEEKNPKGNDAAKKAERSNETLQIDVAAGNEQDVPVSGQLVHVTNLSKVYWKKEGFAKGDLLNYYLRVAPFILPYLKNRPQSLHRHPNGISGAHFFQKDVRGKVPDWIPTFEDYSVSTNETIQYLVCNNEATLLYMANLGCIELHPWHSRTQTPDHPDYCLIDLDPDKGNTYDEVVQTALVVKALLDDLQVPCYCKTSGSTGMHIYLPLGAKYTYEQSAHLAAIVARLVNQELPNLTSVERSPAKRKGKIYLDHLQNSQSKTVAAPYSLRPRPGVPVSTPLHWSEVKKGLKPGAFTATTIFDRLKSEGDLFAPVLHESIDLEAVLQQLERNMSGEW